MLSVTYKPFKLIVIKLNVIMLCVVMLTVVAPRTRQLILEKKFSSVSPWLALGPGYRPSLHLYVRTLSISSIHGRLELLQRLAT
jgi:hypothetical protein